jgi:hypothetical protein
MKENSMQIQNKLITGEIARVAASTPSSVRKTSTPTDSVAFDSANALNNALQDEADVRPEKLERAIALSSQANYPTKTTLRSIANLLAERLVNETE